MEQNPRLFDSDQVDAAFLIDEVPIAFHSHVVAADVTVCPESRCASLPRSQTTQSVWGSGLYLPCEHAVHVSAPAPASVSVTLPAAHTRQAFVESSVY